MQPWAAWIGQAAARAFSGLGGALPGVGTAALTIVGAAFGAGAGVAVVGALGPRRVQGSSPKGIQSRLRAQILGVAPRVGAREFRQAAPDLRTPAGLVVDTPQSGFAEAMRALAFRVLKWRFGENGVAVAVIAPTEGGGATSVALGVARAAALAGKKVVLVDADVRGRAATLELGVDERSGVWAALSGQINPSESPGALDRLITRDDFTALAFLGQSDRVSAMQELYPHPMWPALLAVLKARYELVIVDCAPVGVVDGRMCAAQADAVILVTQWDATPVPHVQIALRGLEGLGAVLPGVFVNGASEDAVRRWQDAPKTPDGILEERADWAL